MDCPSCGTDNPSSASACHGCGMELLSSSSVEEAEETVIYNDEPDLPAFGSRYEVERRLGQGGMGAVYQARDNELDRDIALKEIRPELVDQPDVIARFKREVQLASEITHPNVLRVYDLGDADGKRFLTMQYVDGVTLSAHLRRRGLLEISEIISIFRQLCAALAAAHDKGVVHRDMKPGNVMIDAEGKAFVMDFGLARSLALSGLTQTGAVLGTPHYMSPEQVSGQPVDARTDVYALGVILYQMLTGEFPFQGESTFEIMMQRVQKDPPSAHELNPEIPGYLRKILERCMEREPSLRYADADAVLADLDAQQVETNLFHQVRKRRKPIVRMAVGALLALIIVGGFWLGQRSRTRSEPVDETGSETASEVAVPAAPSLAVVPFANRTGDPDLDWFGEGVARLVMDNLAQSRHVRVVAMDQVQILLEDQDGDLSSAAATQSGIDHLMTGEILRSADGLTVTARLTDTAKGRETTSKRLDGLSSEELIQAADDLAVAVRQGIGIPPTESVDVFAADFASKNAAAYGSYVSGLGKLSDYHYEEAEEAFERALQLAPDFTMARYRLAMVKAEVGRTDEAIAEAQRALEEADSLPRREFLYVQAGEAYISRRYDEAIDRYRELIEAFPYETEARYFLSYILDYQGRFDEELELLDTLARLEPDKPAIWSMRGNVALQIGEFSRAIEDLQRYVRLAPDSANGHHLLGDAYRGQGELDLAADQFRRALEVDPEFHYATTSLAVIEYLQEDPARAEDRLAALVQDEAAPPRNRIDSVFELAAILRAQGRFREAAEWLISLTELIANEKVREAMSLSIQGTCWAELGELSTARTLLEKSIERSPGVATRYLFARGLLELTEGDYDQVLQTADQIRAGGLPPDDPDRTEDKAAAFLRGSTLLEMGDNDRAIEELTRSVALSGYPYALYRVGLARAYLRTDRPMESMAAARQAFQSVDHSSPRLDLELDRKRARLLLAQVHAAMDRAQQAAELAREFLLDWSRADPGLPDTAMAEKLVAGAS